MKIHKMLTLFLLVISIAMLVTGFVYAQTHEDEADAAAGETPEPRR